MIFYQKTFLLLAFVLILSANFSFAARNYTHVVTVGQDSSNYDYTTITDAVAAMRGNNLDKNNLGQIKVYPGTYVECIGGSRYGDDSRWLPEHCDLTGMGTDINDVVIEHPAGTAINAFTIIGAGNNVISHLKIYSNREARNGIYLLDNCRLADCVVDTIHTSVVGETNLVVSDCTIKSMFGTCIAVLDTFSISRCTLNPRGYWRHVEVPKGISAYGSGTIEDVTIMSTIASSYKYEGAGLIGIHVKTSSDKRVTISETKINLQLTTKYHPSETAALRVCGIMNGSQWFEPNLNFPGRTVVKDCDIEVTGIESSSDKAGDGAGIMADGVCVRGGGRVDVIGNTSIKTSRTAASFGDDGYEYSLNNQNGVLTVDFNTVDFDETITNGLITAYDPNEFDEPNEPNEPSEPNEPNEPEPELPHTTTPYSDLKIKPRQEEEKVLIICTQVAKRSEFTIQDANGKGQTFTTHDGSIVLLDGNVVEVTSDITTNTLWTADNVYHVLNPIDVNDALLVIEPGTMVTFAAGTDAGIRIINGAALISRGTPGNEIVYTSDATYPNYKDYYCPIYITETASLAAQVKYSIIEWAYAGLVVLDRKLETNIGNNYFVNCVFGVVEYGLDHTNITNNLFYGSGYGAIEIYLESLSGEASSDSEIYIQNNTCDYSPQWDGISVYGVPDANDAGFVFLGNNIVSNNGRYGLVLANGYMYASVHNTGYYNNNTNKNWEFDEDNPVILETDPYEIGESGYAPICYIDQQCPLVDGGFNYIQQTPMIGKTTATTGLPDSNTTDIGFHYCHWDYNNVGEGDYYPGDLDENLMVDFKDFAILANGWLTTYDINDLADMCKHWLLQGGPAQNITPSFDQDPNNLTGDVSVTVNVSDDEIARVYMFVDGEKYLQYGDIQENPTAYIETQYFRNGPHTVKIISQDANNMVYCSEAVDVNFNNPVSSLITDESFTPGEDFHIMALGSGNYDISVYDIVNETTTYSDTSTGQINVTIPAASFPEEYGAYDFKMTPQGNPDNPLFNFLIRRKFGYAGLYGAGAKGAGTADANDWIMKMVVSIGDKKLEKAKEKCWRAAFRAGVKKGFEPGIIVPADGDEWFKFLKLAITYPYCKIWYYVGHGNYKTIWPWNPERTFISSPSGKIFSYLKKDLDPVPPDYEKVWGYEGCHSIAELGQRYTDKMIWVQINACYSCRNLDFAQMIGTPSDDPIGKQVYIGWKNSALVYDILGNYNQFEYDYWKDLKYGAMLRDAVMDNLPPGGGTRILENFRYFGVIDWQYAWFRWPEIN